MRIIEERGLELWSIEKTGYMKASGLMIKDQEKALNNTAMEIRMKEIL